MPGFLPKFDGEHSIITSKKEVRADFLRPCTSENVLILHSELIVCPRIDFYIGHLLSLKKARAAVVFRQIAPLNKADRVLDSLCETFSGFVVVVVALFQVWKFVAYSLCLCLEIP